MEALHRLAGVQEASDITHSHPPPPPIPQDDVPSQHASRASVPLNREPSHKSLRSAHRKGSRNNLTQGEQANAPAPSVAQSVRRSGESVATSSTDFEWGPSHPCYPHPNPHCLPDSEEYKTTRVIRVRRDWLQAGDLYPQYANLYPEVLDPFVTDHDFRFLIMNINSRLEKTLNPYSWRSWLDSTLSVVTGFLWEDLGLTGAKRGAKALEQFVDKWNAEKAREGKDVRLMQPRRTGMMALDFVIPDPGIDGTREEGYEGGIGAAE